MLLLNPPPLVPAKAGTQSQAKKELDAGFRGHERSVVCRWWIELLQ
jgi:hypothetical protein